MSKLLHFGWFLGRGIGVQGWPTGRPYGGYDWYDPRSYQEAAKALESAGVEHLIIEDTLNLNEDAGGDNRLSLRYAQLAPKPDPLVYSTYILDATRSFGVLPTISASFNHPFTAARWLVSQTLAAGPRVGFNVVTSSHDRAAQNYGLAQHLEHGERFDRADEWITVLRGLWDSWGPEAVKADLEADIFADGTYVNPIHHDGKWFKVRGPLNTYPGTTDAPAIATAGNSPRGKRFAGENADIHLAYGHDLASQKAYVEEVRANAAAAGRDPKDVRVLLLISPIVAESQDQAEGIRAGFAFSNADEVNPVALDTLSTFAGRDLSRDDFDAPFQYNPDAERGIVTQLIERSGGEGVATLRDVATLFQKAPFYLPQIGTPEQIADQLEEIADYSGADGFLWTLDLDEGSVRDVTEKLSPVLARRGRLRGELSAGGILANLRDF